VSAGITKEARKELFANLGRCLVEMERVIEKFDDTLEKLSDSYKPANKRRGGAHT